MAWLAGWGKRVEVLLDHNDIDAAQSDFPHLIEISTSAGYNNKDITFVFDELQNNANRKKIAVTTSDGVTQCYVEIEHWNHAGELAWLWVKVPDVDPDVDTELWLYYDGTHVDNDAYVGDPNDAVVHNVWDVYHKFVSHMRDDPDTSHIRDSTENANDGTKFAADEPIETDGKIGKSQDFDGVEDYVNVPHDDSLNVEKNFTISVWIYPKTGATVDSASIVSKKDTGGEYEGYSLRFPSAITENKLEVHLNHIAERWIDSTGTLTVNSWQYVSWTYNGTISVIYFNGSEDSTNTMTPSTSTVESQLEIGRSTWDINQYFEGIIDEVRISNIVRTPSWIKASYESGRDHLNDFGEEETYTPPVAPPTAGIPPLILRPPPRRIPFTTRLITFGQIRRPLIQAGLFVGRIRRSFQDKVVFTATAVKRIDEKLSMDGFIVTEDIPDHAWEALFEAMENEPVEEELIE